MATKNVRKQEEKTAKNEYEATYSVSELVDAAKTEFGTSRIVVRAALTQAGKEMYTLKEAKKLIDRMKTKEV